MNRIKSPHLIRLQAILFLVFLIITSFFNRFTSDDYHFIGELNNKSFQGIYEHLYFKWHGRWSSNFLLLSFLELRSIPYFLFLYGLFMFSAFYISILRLLQAINHYFKLNAIQLYTYSFLVIGVLFFCTQNPNESWFWYTSSIVYFWSTIAFFYAVGSFLNPQKKWWDYFIFIFSLAYIGGSNEPLTLLTIILLFVLLLKKNQVSFSVLGIVIIITALMLNYLSEGTLHRDEITPGLNLQNLVLYTGYGSLKYLFFQFHITFLPAILFSIPFYYLGEKSSYQTSTFKPIPQLLYSLLIVFLVVGVNQFIVIYVLGGLSPDRATITSSIVITILLIRYLFLLGNHYRISKRNIKALLYFNLIGLVVFNIFFFKIHCKYSKAVDHRISFIKAASHLEPKILIPPLPYSGYLYNAEIKENADYFVNQHLKKAMGVKNDILLKTD